MADKTAMDEKKTTKKVETIEEAVARLNKEGEELVPLELFYDGEKYKDDVSVSVNGKTWLIQRGQPVEVPRKVAEVIWNSQKMRGVAARNREALQKESSI